MSSQPDLAVLETTLGYEFRSREPLVRALTHKSWAYEQNSRRRETLDNEQLEFLGDSILGFLVSEGLLRRFPAYSEGQLSKMGDALEAVLAAIYVDGGLERARDFVEAHVLPVAADADHLVAMEIPDYKSALKEFAQSSRLPPPKYVIVSESGPEHAKIFTVEARLGRELISQADGTSKKAAEQGAARGILERLRSLA